MVVGVDRERTRRGYERSGDYAQLTRIIRTHSCIEKIGILVASPGVQAPAKCAPPPTRIVKGPWFSCPLTVRRLYPGGGAFIGLVTT